MSDVYQMTHPMEVADALEEMRRKLAKQFGVTLTGNRLTLRWDRGDLSLDMHAVIIRVTTAQDDRDEKARQERYEKLYKKYRVSEAELYHAETGEAIQ